ncbi:MAG: molybdopterin-binding oxidoreductase [Alphaproteobacteria bacterium PA4]|nr:MAG: molybdopterin-binding oxidoreductase [Alphaproteobacteria bacterium PA4]
MMLLLAALQVLPIPLDAAARAGLPAASATLTAHGTKQTCTGVWLRDLAARAGAPSGEAVRGPALASVVVAEARDGYRVVFSLGEIDAKLGNAPILVADRCNGQPIGDADGPLRLVVPGDARGARSVRQLQALRLAPVP